MQEQTIELICTLRWPAHRQAGTFQKTIGRDTGTPGIPATYQMPSFPISLLRDANAFEEFCKAHLDELCSRIQQSWEFSYDVMCNNSIVRQSLPPVILPMTFGPFSASKLANAHNELRIAADILWTSNLQTHQIASVQVFKSGIGMTSDAFHDLYRWLWGTKDGAETNLDSIDARLKSHYTRLAKSALEKSDDEAAAQYAKIVFDLAPTDDAAEETMVEFRHLSAYWNKLMAIKENAVKKVATVAREGNAEWWNLVSDRYYRDGLIAPITEEIEQLYASGETEAHRQKIRGLSATNPYKRGLELMESIETNLGFWAAMHAGIITEWPFEELRRRLPASTVEQIQRGSPWSPDTRLEKLAELSYEDTRSVPFARGTISYLSSVHTFLDGTMSGVLTYALEQMPNS